MNQQSRNLLSQQLHPTSPCDGHHPSPRRKRKARRRSSQTQPSQRPRRPATEPSQTAEMNHQSRNVTWNQGHPGLHMLLATPSPRLTRLAAGRTAERHDQSRNVTWNQGHPGLHMSLAAPSPRPARRAPEPSRTAETNHPSRVARTWVVKSAAVRVKKATHRGIWKPKLRALLLHAGLRCPRKRGYPSQRGNRFTADSLLLTTKQRPYTTPIWPAELLHRRFVVGLQPSGLLCAPDKESGIFDGESPRPGCFRQSVQSIGSLTGGDG